MEKKLNKLGVPLKDFNFRKIIPKIPNLVQIDKRFDTTSKDYIRDVRWLQKITGYISYVANKFCFDYFTTSVF